jgi:hypothetical protein
MLWDWLFEYLFEYLVENKKNVSRHSSIYAVNVGTQK